MLHLVLLTFLSAAPVLTKPPVLTHSVQPEFPHGAVDAGTGGVVVMEVDIDATGHVTDVKVVSSAGPAFDEAAVRAARQLEFTPAEVDGQPAPVRISFSSTFAVEAAPEAPDAGAPSVVNLAGQLTAAGSREPIAFGLVRAGGLEARSDAQGRFALRDVPLGPVQVEVSADGYEPFSVEELIKESERTEVKYALRATGGGYETIVRGDRDRREVTSVRLTQQEFRLVAGARNDAFRVVQNLPGVARSPFGGSALVVRGSKAWDSRIYVDEIQIPQLFHFAGLNATFNSQTLESIAFQPGNFGADYGRSTGGLILAEVKTPSKTGLHGAVDVNLFDAAALVEAPLTELWSLSAAGRFGLAQYTVPFGLKTFAPQLESSLGFTLAPAFWDFQLRAERRRPNSRDRLFVTAFGSSDAWAFVKPNPLIDSDVEGNQGTAGVSSLYTRLVVGVDQRLSDRVTFISRNAVGFDASGQQRTTSEVFFRTTQMPIQLRERFRVDVPEANLELGAGLDLLVSPTTMTAQQPPPFKANQLPDPYVERRLTAQEESLVYVEPGAFLDATWTPVPALQLRGGLRFDSEWGAMRKAWAGPRFGARWTPLENLSFKLGAGLYQQPPDYRLGQLSPVFGNPGLLPEAAWHFTVGTDVRLLEVVEVELQGYHKYFFNQARQTLAEGLGSDIDIPGAESRYTSLGYGRAYGVEALVRVRPTRYFVGWVAYTLSRFERDYYGGVAFAPGPLDQPHNLVAVGTFKLPYDVSLGARFRVASGPLVTPVLGALFDINGNYYVPLPGEPWSERLPPFVQLDLRVDKRFVFDAWSLTAYVDVQNATNQQNAEGLLYNHNYSKSAYLTGIPILPTVGVRGEW